MKTTTCDAMGGPCDFQLRGGTADDVIKLQEMHLNEMITGGDESHRAAHEEMRGRRRHPLKGMGWYRATKRQFAALPED